jgi:hypothetical protein
MAAMWTGRVSGWGLDGIVVLPVLIEDRDIPISLREQLYADFRSDFDTGLRTILEAVSRISNAATGRIDEPTYHSDWAFD